MSETLIQSNQLGLGYIRGRENPQLYGEMLREVQFTAPADPPPVIDHRGWLLTENQLAVGSCAGHAGADCAQVCNWWNTRGTAVRMSRMWCYLMGQHVAGLFGRDVGCTIDGIVRAMKTYGVPREETFPYPGRYDTHIPEAAKAEAQAHRIMTAVPLKSYAECFGFLACGIGGIQIGIDWTSTLANNSSGVIERDGGGSLGGHSVSLTGYSDRRDTVGRQYLWLHNSHGTGWGVGGWAEVAPSVVDQWIRMAGWGEFMGLSDMEVYQRRYIDVGVFG